MHRDRSSRVRSALPGRSCDTHVSAGLSHVMVMLIHNYMVTGLYAKWS